MKQGCGFVLVSVLAGTLGLGCTEGAPMPAGPGPSSAADAGGVPHSGGDAGSAGCPGAGRCDAPPSPDASPATDGGCTGPACAGPDASGAACQSNADCPSRICRAGACQALSEARTLRTGPGCSTAEGAARAVFEIPRAGEVSTDFFRLPFPSDVRMKGGRMDLSELPRPGAGLFGFDLVDRYAAAITEDAVGFGLNPAVTFRLTQPVGTPTPTGAGAQAIVFVDLTPGPSQGEPIPFDAAELPAGRYLCAHGLTVRPASWRPLRPGHTYAVLLTETLADRQGQPVAPDADFLWMLSAVAPVDPALRAAWVAHAPLRAWLPHSEVPASSVIAAAVFTTDQVAGPAAGIHARLAAGEPARITELVRCGAGAGSACDDERTPPCASVTPADFDEYRGQIEIPVFQEGTPPYESVGGNLRFGAEGPEIVRREPVCFTLTVPKGTAPAAGWPLLVYAHGTGGHHRSQIDSGLAGELAAGEDWRGPPIRVAMLGYDGVLHGPRKGSSSRSVEELVYNFLNPRAARTNNLQAAADLFAIASAVSAFPGRGVAIDPARLGLYGHSQGGNAAAVAAAFENRFGAVVLTGTGGGLARSLLEKSKPVSVSQLLPVFLADPVAGPDHPVLALLQHYFDAADPLSFGRYLFTEPRVGGRPHHLLHVYGTMDNFSPESTQRIFAAAAGLPVVRPIVATEHLADFAVIPAPVQSNIESEGGTVTAVQVQYPGGSTDGHFVGTHHLGARTTIQRFFSSYFGAGVPLVE